jgi:hypothetical protein
MSFEELDFGKISYKDNTETENEDKNIYDITTNEVYRIKRYYGIDPLTDRKVDSSVMFKYKYKWDPYTGKILGFDEIGPLCFNALDLYNYYFENRYKGLWNPSEGQYEGYFGDMLGTGFQINIKSRGCHPEKYLFRIPIIDCYLPANHNYSIITMGPLLTKDDIDEIDYIVKKNMLRKNNFTSLSEIKKMYDKSINNEPTKFCYKFKQIMESNPNKSRQEIIDIYNRYWVNKLVALTQ